MLLYFHFIKCRKKCIRKMLISFPLWRSVMSNCLSIKIFPLLLLHTNTYGFFCNPLVSIDMLVNRRDNYSCKRIPPTRCACSLGAFKSIPGAAVVVSHVRMENYYISDGPWMILLTGSFHRRNEWTYQRQQRRNSYHCLHHRWMLIVHFNLSEWLPLPP